MKSLSVLSNYLAFNCFKSAWSVSIAIFRNLLFQNPHILYLVLSAMSCIVFNCLHRIICFLNSIKVSALKFSMLLIKSSIILLTHENYCLLPFFLFFLFFFLEEFVQSKFLKNQKFVYIGLRMCVIVNVWMYQRTIPSWCYINKNRAKNFLSWSKWNPAWPGWLFSYNANMKISQKLP